MTLNDTLLEIKSVTLKLIENGLSIQEKHPQRVANKIVWESQSDVSIALKNIPYSEKYSILSEARNFNIKMLDGALLQFMYEFNSSGRKLLSHRLAFFPSPFVERYDDVPDEYENIRFGNSEFHDMIEKNIVSFPIRFDYNVDDKFFKEVEHPYSHVTFGEYEFCRIPVNAPLTPTIFINFIINNFYNYAYKTKGWFIPISGLRFDNTITANECLILHLNISK